MCNSLLKALFFSHQNGETWHSNNCTTETCQNGQHITTHVQCNVKDIVCENRQTPVKVYDENGCCFHYECKCKFQ